MHRNIPAEGHLPETRGEPGEPEVSGRCPSAASIETHPDPEVVENPKRRRFSAGYKLRILKEADNAGLGGVGELLRREGLFSSHLTKWRQLRQHGSLKALAERKRGPEPKTNDLVQQKIRSLEHENSVLKQQLKRAEQIIDIQKKISEILNVPQNQMKGTEIALWT